MKAESIADDVLLMMGEDPRQCLWTTGDESSGCSLRRRIHLEIEPRAAEAVAETPFRLLTGWKRWSDTGVSISADGCVTLPLPDDFLLFGCIRMKSWQRDVTELLDSTHWLMRLQQCRWKGLRGTPARPLASLGVSGGKRVVRLYSSPTGDTLAEAFYIPVPKINAAGEIEIPPAAYRRCLELISDAIT